MKRVKKIAIVDLDVHHGNGTEEICRDFHNRLPEGSEPKVLFLSTHLHDRTPAHAEDGHYQYEFYPGSGDLSDLPHNVVNVPLKPLWRRRGANNVESTRNWMEKFYFDHWGRSEFKRVVEERILPPLRAFHPDLILVSAGFDAAHKDLGNCRFLQKQLDGFDLEREDFFWVAGEIAKIAEICCEGRLVSVLEGGYGKLAEASSPSNTGNATAANGGFSRNGGGSRRGSSNNKIDRSVLARNVQGYIEGLCGGSLRPVEKPEDDSENNDSELDFVDPIVRNADDDQYGDFMNSDEGLILGGARRSGRVKRQKRSIDADGKGVQRGGDEKRRRKSSSAAAAAGGDDMENFQSNKASDQSRENALRYLRKVRELNENDYHSFLTIMEKFRSRSLDVNGVVTAVKTLFAGRNDLILGFNMFLPATHKIKLDG